MTPLALDGASVRRAGRAVLSDASLQVRAGELVGVVGANGAGKSTLLRAMLGLARLHRGRARLAGREVGALPAPQRARLAGYLPQERHVGWNMPAWRVAGLGAHDAPPALARARALAALTRVGLGPLRDRGVLDMSGGERARVLLARLLVTGAPALVADEPVAGLDPDAQLLAVELLREEAARGAAVVMTLHDLALAARVCDRLVVVARGRIVADGPPLAALSREVLADAFHLDGELAPGPGGPVLAVRRLPAREVPPQGVLAVTTGVAAG